MNTVIIQKDVFERGKKWFVDSGLEFLPFSADEENLMIKAHYETNARCFIIGADNYSNEFFNCIKPNSLVIRYGVGYDNIPIKICNKRLILVANTPGTLEDSVAEHTIALLLSSARKIPQINRSIQKGVWPIESGIELKGKTLAIIGLGNIGFRTATIAKLGFQMRIAAFDKKTNIDRRILNIVDLYSSNFSKVVADADFISLHLSLNKETKMFIDEEKLKLMPRKAILINTSRGELVNEDALYKALKNKEIAGAALDVFYHEPYKPMGGDLRNLDNVICTSHVASNTDSANKRMSILCIKNALNFYLGKINDLTLIPESSVGSSDG